MNHLHDRPQEPERSYNRAHWKSLHDHDEIEESENEIPTVADESSPKPAGDVAKRVGSQYPAKFHDAGFDEDEIRDMRG